MILAVGIIFVAGYLLITLEHRYQLHKAITAAAMGALLWLLIGLAEGEAAAETVERAGAEIFGLVFFLLAAMTLVEILVDYRFFDWIRMRLMALKLSDRWQLWVLSGVAFVLSALIDNLTATLVMLTITGRFFHGSNLLAACCSIVVAANAGGAWSPIGDVTTIMLWLAGKFTAVEIITWAIVPSIVLFFVSTWMIQRHITTDTPDEVEDNLSMSVSEKTVSAFALASFILPLAFSQIGLPPYFGLLMGLGVAGIVMAITHRAMQSPTNLSTDIEQKLSRVDLASLVFFAGILLAVAALEHVHILDQVSSALMGNEPGLARYVAGIGAMGAVSAIVDNIPLTAGAIRILKTEDPAIWALMAIAVGTGGSMLSIGSAAGVVAMGRLKDLTFARYLKIATVPAAVGYVAALLVWWIQYQLVR